MWQADEAQQARINELVEALKEEIPVLWEFGQTDIYRDSPDHCRALRERLQSRFGAELLDRAMPEFLAFPDANPLPKDIHAKNRPGQRINWIGLFVAAEWVGERGGAYAIGLIADRLRHLIAHAGKDPEVAGGWKYSRGQGNIYTLHIEECIGLLVRLCDRPEALDHVEGLLRGRWDGLTPIISGRAVEDFRYGLRHLISGPLLGRIKTPLGVPAPRDEIGMLERLDAAGRLDYDCFVEVFRHLPDIVPAYLIGYPTEEVAGLSPYQQKVREFLIRLEWDAAQTWNEENIQVLLDLPNFHRRGGRWLEKACEYTEALGLAALGGEDYMNDPSEALRLLSWIFGLDPDEDAEALAERLRRFKEKTLFAVLPMANAGEEAVLRALGWSEALPLVAWLRQTAEVCPEVRGLHKALDIPNSDDPSSGVIDRRHLLELLGAIDPAQCKKLVAAYRGGKVLGNTLTLVEAAAGWNRKKVETAVVKHGQIALKAYGLLPLERGEAEVLERYLLLKRVAKEAAKHGAERQANTRAAVQGGLANLAQTAGYPDLTRLEWAMESRVADDGAPLDRRETLADWEVELTLDGLAPRLQVFKQGKPLKSEPAGLKKDARFLAFKETQGQIKAQLSRFRTTLEGMMTEGDLLSPDDLQNLARIPAASRLLQGLILRTKAGGYGVFDPQGQHLAGLGGAAIPLNGAMCIAHPYHLFRDGLLPDWQREVVRRRIVQPFKQAFRELYVLTPAEEETGDYSNRFAGHALKPSVTSRLLQGRGWQMASGDSAEVYKLFRKAGLLAEFDFPDAGHYLSETESVTSDQLRFRVGRDPMPLNAVPPLIFSEVMRDADLVVSVAQLQETDELWSAESYRRRAELVAALVADLGLQGVCCEGHFAYVTGKRASYRVHLGSAAIHIEPGNYLCIVPDRAGAKDGDDLFLPFADAEPKTSEVISKILLLANDDRITDKSILKQIERTH